MECEEAKFFIKSCTLFLFLQIVLNKGGQKYRVLDTYFINIDYAKVIKFITITEKTQKAPKENDIFKRIKIKRRIL